MAITVFVALIVLGSALLIGLIMAARHRDVLSPALALALALPLILVGGSTMLYPSAMIVQDELIY